MTTDENLPEDGSNEPCAYCGARPTWPVVWSSEDGSSYTIYLCAECDEQELGAFDRE